MHDRMLGISPSIRLLKRPNEVQFATVIVETFRPHSSHAMPGAIEGMGSQFGKMLQFDGVEWFSVDSALQIANGKWSAGRRTAIM